MELDERSRGVLPAESRLCNGTRLPRQRRGGSGVRTRRVEASATAMPSRSARHPEWTTERTPAPVRSMRAASPPRRRIAMRRISPLVALLALGSRPRPGAELHPKGGPRGNRRSRPRSDLDAGELAGLGQRPTCLSTSPPLPTSPRPSTNPSGANQPPGQNPAPLTVTGNRRSRRPRSRTATHLLAHHPGPTTPIPGAPDGPPQLDGDHHRSRAHKRDQRRRAAARHSRADDRLGPQLTDPRTADAERKRHLHSERARSRPTTPGVCL
jgi:hypothetical protein